MEILVFHHFHFDLNMNEAKNFPVKMEVSIFLHIWLPKHEKSRKYMALYFLPFVLTYKFTFMSEMVLPVLFIHLSQGYHNSFGCMYFASFKNIE